MKEYNGKKKDEQWTKKKDQRMKINKEYNDTNLAKK